MNGKLMVKCAIAAAALAASPMAFAERAVHIADFGCGVIDGDGNGFVTNDTKSTTTNARNGVVIMKCQARGVPNGTGTAVNYDYASTGLLCSVLSSNGAFVTQDWHETVSASGNATLTCRYKNP